ncbi:AAA family ATPase [Candidatus Nomurabacteria bacterium]|nr:AAA family ATPase [Candidatus Nomurabacteria bacterium]MCB9820336.1 AAA family ATPase [Candidatus Nomurabacteria bacterium]
MLKSIELNGFKSFAKKNELFFNTPVTAIVGPNGSGKSNVVESIRFVLGEQSMKSLRGKSSSDLIFKGSKVLSSPNRAKVSIVFDNKDKKFSFSEDLNISLDFNEIVIAREVFKDGGSTYTINGSEVRLKDINDLLSSVNIGSSGHHIISQGEADRLLSASIKERREMIEDALGLKSYQYKLKESERRLEKSIENLKEVNIQRREIAPHLKFLKKQVEKSLEAKSVREELTSLYAQYLALESHYIKNTKQDLTNQISVLKGELSVVESSLSSYKNNVSEDEAEVELEKNVSEINNKIAEIRTRVDELIKEEAKISAFIEIEKSNLDKYSKTEKSEITIYTTKIKSFVDSSKEILQKINKSSDTNEIQSLVKELLGKIEREVEVYYKGENILEKDQVLFDIKEKIANLSKDISTYAERKSKFLKDIEDLESKKSALYSGFQSMQSSNLEKEKEYSDKKLKKQELESKITLIEREISSVEERETSFEEEVKEGSILIGSSILDYKNKKNEEEIDKEHLTALKKDLERLKIKLESLGGASGEDMEKEYQETLTRDQYLEKESEDIENSKSQIEDIIKETKEIIEEKFQEGVNDINKTFQEYFETMFGGGRAFLEVVTEKRRRRSEEDELEQEDVPLEKGIDIHVNLPQKKVKELMMLSGGERSLTSIALLFAISSVNPPPFIVLDETDAALDEANSRRYGDMLEKLSKHSQLIVVTHNRETMSRAQVLYGVTLGSDGGSRLLTVQFEEAVKVAK